MRPSSMRRSGASTPVERPGHRGAQVAERERLGENVGDGGVEAFGALALVGEAGHEDDREVWELTLGGERQRDPVHHRHADVGEEEIEGALLLDRKSTRLNSSHANISYAVFCLKKKKT